MLEERTIEVLADWDGLDGPTLMGTLKARPSRGKEIFSFEYDTEWLSTPGRVALDPELVHFSGQQYPQQGRESFGMFLDSSPDRWGRMLLRRREAISARSEGRVERPLVESDYLLGVHDLNRSGALRFRVDGVYRDDHPTLAAPPLTSLRELEHASRALDQRTSSLDADDEERWLRMLIAPGGSLGGARPKASVSDEAGRLWVAKFPSDHDDDDVGLWEGVAHALAELSGVEVPQARIEALGQGGHTFLSQRFDRTPAGRRIHMASAMTLLMRSDGDDAGTGASYLELAGFLTRFGTRTDADLEQLWTRIVFNVCVANSDDHLRNHAFLLTPSGWRLAPAYDMNPNPYSDGLTLNISESDNTLDLALAFEVAPYFRLDRARAKAIAERVVSVVRDWRAVASAHGITTPAQDRMQRAFRGVDT